MQNIDYLRIRRQAGGFTLSEILITLVIVGFIGALGVPMLGQQKLKKPVEVLSPHGTMECFWEGEKVMQFTSNNTNNKTGELTEATDGACYFTVPTAMFVVLQAVGAGGNGAVGMIGEPSYTSSTIDVTGSIPTGPGFLAAISDTKVPDWVRKEWNKQWTNTSKWITYTLTSPIGSSGDGFCETRRKDFDNPDYNQCSSNCRLDLEKTCPSACLVNLEASGGESGKGARITVKTKLEYEPEGQQDNVVFTTSYDETTLTIGDNKTAKLLASGSGGSAYGKNGVAHDGAPGTDVLPNNYSVSGMTLQGQPVETSSYGPGTGCKNIHGHAGTVGSISGGSPSSIPYRTQQLSIKANFGVAGSPGNAERRIFEKIPPETQLKLVPSKNNSGGNGYSTIYIKNDKTDNWKKLMNVGPGADGWGGTQELPIEAGDLPFPKAYYPNAFRASTPELSIASGVGYTSYLAKHKFSAGAPGTGAHPIVKKVTGKATHYINGVVTGNEDLTPVSGESNTCFDGTTSTTGTCGMDSKNGRPGAVIISW